MCENLPMFFTHILTRTWRVYSIKHIKYIKYNKRDHVGPNPTYCTIAGVVSFDSYFPFTVWDAIYINININRRSPCAGCSGTCHDVLRARLGDTTGGL